MPKAKILRTSRGALLDRRFDALVVGMQTRDHAKAVRNLETLPLSEILRLGAAKQPGWGRVAKKKRGR